MGKFQDLTGCRFGRLTVIKRVENHISKSGQQKTMWLCKCDCGNETIVSMEHLKKDTISCGCYKKENTIKIFKKHGLSGSRLEKCYNHMISRCYNKKNKAYKYYGGRGIKVCDEWLNDNKKFFNWSINNGYKYNLTIDRINVNGNYEPNNCRWATNKEQAQNKRNNIFIEYNNEKYCLKEWCDILGLSYVKTYKRLFYRKWSVEKAFNLK